ncbi:MAG: HDIG domain-containing protein [Candidatus Omnitrophica bacterium]|nr:HDIG domain-containing protein [Candidatus Omnitrophota bacterium]
MSIDLKQARERMKKFFSRKETVSGILLFFFVTLVLATMFLSPRLYRGSVSEGDVALKDVYAPYDFTYGWGRDQEATKAAMERAVEDIPYVLYRDQELEEEVVSSLQGFFSAVKAAKETEGSESEKINALRGALSGEISPRNLGYFLDYEDTDELADRTFSIVEKVFMVGYAPSQAQERLREEGARNVVVRDRGTGSEFSREAEDLLSTEGVEDLIGEYASAEFPSDRRTRQAVEQLVRLEIGPNLILDEKTSILHREEVLEGVKPVLEQWKVKKDELIIEKGERVNARHIAQMSEIRSFFRPGKSPKFFLGVMLLFFLLGLIAVVHTSSLRRKDLLSVPKELSIILINMLFIIVVADIIMRSPQPSYFIPMASIAMLIVLLLDFNTAFMTVILMSVWISLLVGGGAEVGFALLLGSVVGMFAVKGARRRGNILWAGLFAGIAKFLAIVCIGLINSMDNEHMINDGLWGLASGIFSGFIVMCILPVYEYFFKAPTNISLLELSDMNHPLLKRLAMEAPGTYHHSIMVGNLAEAACDAIGANSLLARVGSYYHDVGKISKAEYFSENEMGAKSKHEKLTPQMSTLIISNHVKEGVDLAKKHKLNNALVDFIAQHHGDSLIAYFYQKALEKAEPGQEIDERNFRYPGPRPQTKETAIVLLADSVEASSRSLDEPTPASIRNLVKKIVNNKFIDGQLDECEITLKNVHTIAESFVRVLMGVFHTRLKYPEDTRKNGEKVVDKTASRETRPGNGKNDKNKPEKPQQKKKG